MQSGCGEAQYRAYGSKQEWGAKARKRESRQFRVSSRERALAEALEAIEPDEFATCLIECGGDVEAATEMFRAWDA